MSIFKKLICLSFFSFLMSPIYANECINQIENRRIDVALFFQRCELKDEDVKPIVNYVNNHPGIKRIFLSNNDITDKGIKQLSLLNSAVDFIDLSSNKIQGRTLASLQNLDLFGISLDKNPIDSAGVKDLLMNKQINAFTLSSNSIDDAIVDSVINREFDALGIQSTGLSLAAWQKIAEFSKAKILIAAGTKENINDNFAEKLANNRYLEVLYLKDNTISSKGFTSIFSNPNIHGFETSQLNESSTFVEPLGKSVYIKSLFVVPESDVILNATIGKFLSVSRSLDALLFYPDTDLIYQFSLDADFADAISKTAITKLITFRYKMNDAAAIKLAQSEHLTILNLDASDISTAGAIALANNHSLVELSLFDNQVSDEGALAFINNEHLESLDLNHNPISQSAAEKLLAGSKIKNIWINFDRQMQVANKLKMHSDQQMVSLINIIK